MVNGVDKQLIFISYSSFDTEAKGLLERHFGVLQNLGEIHVWEDSQIGLGDDWFQEIQDKLETCAVAVLLISHDFLSSKFCMKEEVPLLLERRKRDGMMIAPILLGPCAWKIVPWLQAIQMFPQKAKPLRGLSDFEQAEKLTEVVLAVHAHLEERKAKAAEASTEEVDLQPRIEAKPDTPFPALPKGSIDLTRLPTSGFDVVGRDKELQFLNEAFDGDTLNVVSLRAWGGVGKSTLVNKWCEYLAADNYRGAGRAFAWSFYSQGASERVTSADAFIDAALRFFGDVDPEAGSAWAKGERLAELVGKERSLLLLDGMEPLQDEHQGIKDPALSRLVECLAAENTGLCVITTREPVKELSGFPKTTVEKNLEQLSKEAGRALLRIKGLRADDDLLEEVSEAFGNHALALDLLANYLRLTRRPVAAALDIADLPLVSVDDGKHPRRVMDAFAEQFGEGPELDLLHVMGLFDRPADAGCIASLREPPVIPGLTDHLVQENGDRLATWWRRAVSRSEAPSADAIWEKLLAHLRSLGLLAAASHYAPDELDAHPLVREHFGALLRVEREDAWKAGHDRLYGHLKALPKAFQPDSLQELEPLFRAVSHGCAAERYFDTLWSVYLLRIRRDDQNYHHKKLGAFAADLASITGFFEKRWTKCNSSIDQSFHRVMIGQAGLCLRAIGRLSDAEASFAIAHSLSANFDDEAQRARGTSNLSELALQLGDVEKAISLGRESVILSFESTDKFIQIVASAILADALHQSGQNDEAEKYFCSAELSQRKYRSNVKLLYSIRSHQYCELLLTQGRKNEAFERGNYTAGFERSKGTHLDIGLGKLIAGRAAQALDDRDNAGPLLNQAVACIIQREAADMA